MTKTLIQMLVLIFSFVIFLPTSFASNNVLFEGYHKVLLQGKHIGFTVSRYEFDNKEQKFKATYFLKTSGTGSDITESLKATAGKDLAPISYEYTSVVGKETKTIDAKAQKGVLTATVRENGKSKSLKTTLPKGSFFSTFLVYLILQSPQGLQAESNYQYQAIAEEDGQLYKGEALVGKEESKQGVQAFKVLNTFKDTKFISYVSKKGEIVGTEAMSMGLTTEAAPSLDAAAGSLPKSEAIIKSLFKTLPAAK